MAVTPVTLGPVLRAWALAGVSHILCDGPVDPVYLGNEGAGASRPVPPPVGRPPFTQAPPMGDAGSARPLKSAEPVRPPAVAAAPVAGAERAASERTAGVSTPSAFAARREAPEDPAAWPEPWSGWFARITPAPVLWTYHELGADLTGLGRSPERSAFFKNLIAELGLPKGSSVFWPSAMPVAEEGAGAILKAHPPVFAAGLTRLGPLVVIVFGETALADMGLAGRIRYFRQEMVEGKLFLCLPEIGTLLENQSQRASAVSLLRAMLASVAF